MRSQTYLFVLIIIIFTVIFLIDRTSASIKKVEEEEDHEDRWHDKCSADHIHSVCKVMAPRSGTFTAQDVYTSPWKVYTWKPKIQQYFTHPVVLGSDSGKEIFSNFIVVARSVVGGQILGHFEYQWDSIPVCCYEKGRNYSYEGTTLHPNLLHGSSVRILKPNQTVLWTAPKYFTGPIVFMATFSTSCQMYWPNVTSDQVEVIRRNQTRFPFNPSMVKKDLHEDRTEIKTEKE